jgi:SWI/SNF-related matrix-associated actin-dependent regulator of chromatin subfamily A3
VIAEENARISICKHIFCRNCIETVIQKQHKCPMCRTVLSSPEKTLVEPAPPIDQPQEEQLSLETLGASSSKLDALLQILQGIYSSKKTNGSHEE